MIGIVCGVGSEVMSRRSINELKVQRVMVRTGRIDVKGQGSLMKAMPYQKVE